eukprot:14541408-Alexandrium_andersonii.AAC.1
MASAAAPAKAQQEAAAAKRAAAPGAPGRRPKPRLSRNPGASRCCIPHGASRTSTPRSYSRPQAFRLRSERRGRGKASSIKKRLQNEHVAHRAAQCV